MTDVVVVVLSSDRFLVAVGLFSSPDVFLAVLDTFLLLFTRVLFCGTFLDSLNCLPGGLLAFDIPEIIRFFNPNDYLKNLCIKTSSLLILLQDEAKLFVLFVIFSRFRLRILIRVDVLITRLFIKRSGAVNVMVQEFNKLIVFSFIRQFPLLCPGLGVHRGDGGGQAAGPGVLGDPPGPRHRVSRPHGARGGQVTWHQGRGYEL